MCIHIKVSKKESNCWSLVYNFKWGVLVGKTIVTTTIIIVEVVIVIAINKTQVWDITANVTQYDIRLKK